MTWLADYLDSKIADVDWTLYGCCEGNAAGDSPVLGHLSRDAAAATTSASFVVMFSASLTQMLVRLMASAAITR